MIAVFPSIQTHAFYLHLVTLTWFKDLNVPEMYGFLPNQVTPFPITIEDGIQLHAWHTLPLCTYLKHKDQPLELPSGFTEDMSRLNVQLLRENSDAQLVIYLHGTSGTIASGVRPDSLRAVYSVNPTRSMS
ncbi:hypothetical protein K469DRAFT_783793 [Zopfia rhizophila CBS 207.26]|uniref:Uncharacterized protein n=1 Tax=Zopfia rhizophila CBS 207.26 TaxID=1314779 RepID=A0A6A6E0C9_9PEZI|nr:hypothetical protein K469DRAFT_783793 [Zopfia rhizophila CBS 207.26]